MENRPISYLQGHSSKLCQPKRPASARFTTTVVSSLAYAGLCFILAIAAICVIFASPLEQSTRVPLAGVALPVEISRWLCYAGVFAFLCAIALVVGRQRLRFKNRNYGSADVIALLLMTTSVGIAGFALVCTPYYVHYYYMINEQVQERVCNLARTNKPTELRNALADGAHPHSMGYDQRHEEKIGALVHAARAGNAICVDVLLNYGADPDGIGPTEIYGNSPLYEAVLRDDPEIALRLITRGAHTTCGNYYLLDACTDRHSYRVAETILKAGVSAAARDHWLTYSRASGDKQMVALITHRNNPSTH